MARIAAWFPTLIYCERLQPGSLVRFNADLLDTAYRIRDHDEPGRRWSAPNYPLGYTSYGSLDRLHQFASPFDELRQRLEPHIRRFAQAQQWNLRGVRLQMTDCWLNIMPRGCAHSFHLHPQAVISGTYYVKTPRGSSPLKFEDPRLSRLMAAPARKAGAKQQAHIRYPARAGQVILFESWLRHEVPASAIDEERVSISFNYHWR